MLPKKICKAFRAFKKLFCKVQKFKTFLFNLKWKLWNSCFWMLIVKLLKVLKNSLCKFKISKLFLRIATKVVPGQTSCLLIRNRTLLHVFCTYKLTKRLNRQIEMFLNMKKREKVIKRSTWRNSKVDGAAGSWMSWSILYFGPIRFYPQSSKWQLILVLFVQVMNYKFSLSHSPSNN